MRTYCVDRLMSNPVSIHGHLVLCLWLVRRDNEEGRAIPTGIWIAKPQMDEFGTTLAEQIRNRLRERRDVVDAKIE